MQGIEAGPDKVKKICDLLRRETLEPAMQKAEEIIAAAEKRALEIIEDGKQRAALLQKEASQEIARERNVFEASLQQACRQALGRLKQDIEETLLNQNLSALLTAEMGQPQVLADLITALVTGIEKGGIDVDLSAWIPSRVPAHAVNELLAHAIKERLREKGVLIGLQTGGIELTLHGQKITIDVTDQAVSELVSAYIRKDFRKMIFQDTSAF